MMSMIKITVNQKDLSHIFACLANLKTTVIDLYKNIPEESAREFATLLRANLINQKFSAGYRPLGLWKKNEPNATRFWEWYGEALKSIKYYKVGTGAWFAGFGTGGIVTGIGRGSRKKSTGKTKSAVLNAKRMEKRGIITRKPGQTTAEALANRKALIAQSVSKAKTERIRRQVSQEAAAPGAHTPEHLKHLIGQTVPIDFSTVEKTIGSGRSVSFGHETKKVRSRQRN